MSSYISKTLRFQIADRANHLCEYCLIHEEDTFFGCEIDHIVSLKHGGKTDVGNLAYACVLCNRKKGSDIGSNHSNTCKFFRFFNPRKDKWIDHFRLDKANIISITEIGEVTLQILGINNSERILEREELIKIKRYPSPFALAHIKTQ